MSAPKATIKKLPSTQQFIDKLSSLRDELNSVIADLTASQTPAQLFFAAVTDILQKNFVDVAAQQVYITFANVLQQQIDSNQGVAAFTNGGKTAQAAAGIAINQGASLVILQKIGKLLGFTITQPVVVKTSTGTTTSSTSIAPA